MGEHGSRVRQALSRLRATNTELDAAQEQEVASRLGGTLVQSLPARCTGTVCGTLQAVALRPRGGVPALEAELSDGSGTISVIWLGRRQIAGIEPGRRLKVHGRVGHDRGRRVIYNPRYELLPPGLG